MSSAQRVFLIFGLFFIAMQFISIDIHAKQANSNEINIDNPAKDIFEKHCFDCHSNQTKVPFYGNIAPMSWIVQKDVRDARAIKDGAVTASKPTIAEATADAIFG